MIKSNLFKSKKLVYNPALIYDEKAVKKAMKRLKKLLNKKVKK